MYKVVAAEPFPVATIDVPACNFSAFRLLAFFVGKGTGAAPGDTALVMRPQTQHDVVLIVDRCGLAANGLHRRLGARPKGNGDRVAR